MTTNIQNLYTVYHTWSQGAFNPRVGAIPIIKKTAKTYRIEASEVSHFANIVRIKEVDCEGFFFTTPELAIRNAQDRAQSAVTIATREFDKVLALTFSDDREREE